LGEWHGKILWTEKNAAANFRLEENFGYFEFVFYKVQLCMCMHMMPGVDFRRFSAKKLAFFSKTNVMIKFLHNVALFWVKNANFFAKCFSENI
jgi:hypothetical protein